MILESISYLWVSFLLFPPFFLILHFVPKSSSIGKKLAIASHLKPFKDGKIEKHYISSQEKFRQSLKMEGNTKQKLKDNSQTSFSSFAL